jgi:hypothetical protein
MFCLQFFLSMAAVLSFLKATVSASFGSCRYGTTVLYDGLAILAILILIVA